jgi:hypothetical protein
MSGRYGIHRAMAIGGRRWCRRATCSCWGTIATTVPTAEMGGGVDSTTVKGQAFLIYWSWDAQDGIRWGRIGKPLD